MKCKAIYLLLSLLPFNFVSQITTTIEIRKGTSNINSVPFNGLYDYSQFGTIYTRDEILNAGIDAGIDLSNGGNITSLFFEYYGWSSGYVASNQTVKISHSDATQIERGPFGDGLSYAYPDYGHLTLRNTTVVKDDFTFTNPNSENWEEIGGNTSGQTSGFDTPFYWNGVDNILISWENRDGSWMSGYGFLKGGGDSRRAHNWYNDNSYPTASSGNNKSAPNIKLNFESFTPLPIALDSFTGIVATEAENQIQLDWTTQSEKDNDYFTIWRSFKGQDWQEIGHVIGSGNSNELINYQYIDRIMISQHGNNKSIYYKLSQTDYDGTQVFFHVILVEIKSAKTHIVRRTNLVGQEVDTYSKGWIIETWNNGEVVKTVHE